MASEIDIVNLALSRLGDDATVASLYPPEGSAQAEHGARFYPVARDTLLEMHHWGFATKRGTLAEFAGDYGCWAYAYALPGDAIKILDVFAEGAGDDCSVAKYEREALPNGVGAIYTNEPMATVRYIARITDTTKFSPLFVDALAWLLASYLAGPILKGDAGMAMAQRAAQMAQMMFGRAAESDANQRRMSPEHTPDWISARGATTTLNTWGR